MKVGDSIVIAEGPMTGRTGKVTSISDTKLKISVSVFGRECIVQQDRPLVCTPAPNRMQQFAEQLERDADLGHRLRCDAFWDEASGDEPNLFVAFEGARAASLARRHREVVDQTALAERTFPKGPPEEMLTPGRVDPIWSPHWTGIKERMRNGTLQADRIPRRSHLRRQAQNQRWRTQLDDDGFAVLQTLWDRDTRRGARDGFSTESRAAGAIGPLVRLEELPESVNWAALAGLSMPDAIQRVFGPAGPDAEAFVARLASHTKLLAAATRGDTWYLVYLCDRVANAPKTAADGFYTPATGHAWAWGAPPRHEDATQLNSYAMARGWKVPAALEQFYVCHHGWGVPDRHANGYQIAPTHALKVHGELMNPIAADQNDPPVGYAYDDLLSAVMEVDADGHFFHRAQADGVVFWSHEERNIGNVTDFWSFMATGTLARALFEE